ncbi:class I SAM-dependent methyltransferase [Acidimangrovimonas pyrenivorans]|uniref:Class I SAM-dependent methyltransferase n=1 Tax=Acidimangrovimonas pyrenivorans TaxID=2030798 RepID=A0ABV7AN99_9RHOB
MTTRREHWDHAYGGAEDADLSWFEAEPRHSLDAILQKLPPGAAVVDIGGGTARLAEALLEAGRGPVTVLDLSREALRRAQDRLGERAAEVIWIAADITAWQPDRRYAVWHDRAVFHFLTDAKDRAAYVRTLDAALEPGGTAIIATFAADGPERCSGLPVRRYAPEQLAAELERLAPGVFTLTGAVRFTHVTPRGVEQKFQQSSFRKAG